MARLDAQPDQPDAPGGIPAPTPRATGSRGSLWPTPPALTVPWTLRQTLIGAALTVVPLFTLIVASQLAPQSAPPTAPLSAHDDSAQAVVVGIASALVEAVFLIAPLYIAFTRRPAGTPRRSGLIALGWRGFAFAPAVALFIGGWIVIYGFSALYSLLRVSTNADALARQAAYEPAIVLAALIVSIVVAPVCEEVFFRGFLFTGLAQRMPVWAAVGVSAVVFGLAHADLGSFVPLVVIGVVLAVLRWRTGSLWPGILLHALNNAVAAIAIFSSLHAHPVR